MPNKKVFVMLLLFGCFEEKGNKESYGGLGEKVVNKGLELSGKSSNNSRMAEIGKNMAKIASIFSLSSLIYSNNMSTEANELRSVKLKGYENTSTSNVISFIDLKKRYGRAGDSYVLDRVGNSENLNLDGLKSACEFLEGDDFYLCLYKSAGYLPKKLEIKDGVDNNSFFNLNDVDLNSQLPSYFHYFSLPTEDKGFIYADFDFEDFDRNLPVIRYGRVSSEGQTVFESTLPIGGAEVKVLKLLPSSISSQKAILVYGGEKFHYAAIDFEIGKVIFKKSIEELSNWLNFSVTSPQGIEFEENSLILKLDKMFNSSVGVYYLTEIFVLDTLSGKLSPKSQLFRSDEGSLLGFFTFEKGVCGVVSNGKLQFLRYDSQGGVEIAFAESDLGLWDEYKYKAKARKVGDKVLFVQEGTSNNVVWQLYSANGEAEKGVLKFSNNKDFSEFIDSDIYCLQNEMSCISYLSYGGGSIKRISFK